MVNAIKNWNGLVTINNIEFNNGLDASNFDFKTVKGPVSILLQSNKKTVENESNNKVVDVSTSALTKIKVRQYMTKKSSGTFDFMKKWNNDIPMPMRVMVGSVVKETKGMVYMKLHADILQEQTSHCMCCGRQITNPVSRYFGMGPECGGHNYVNPFENDTELKKAVGEYRKRLREITWEGWVIKSAIEEREDVIVNE